MSAERCNSGRPPGGGFVAGAWILERALTWGTDGNGRFEGTGGVGGLLMMEEKPGSTTGVPVGAYYPLYGGSGNITQLLDSAGGVAAHYDYDAFGNVTAATGPAAANNPWRFSKPRQLRLVQVISCDDWRGRDPCPDNASTEDFEKAFTTGC